MEAPPMDQDSSFEFPIEIIETIVNFLPLEDRWRPRLISTSWNAVICRDGDFKLYRKVAILSVCRKRELDVEFRKRMRATAMYGGISLPRYPMIWHCLSSSFLYDATPESAVLPRPLKYLYMSFGNGSRTPVFGDYENGFHMMPLREVIYEIGTRKPDTPIPFAQKCNYVEYLLMDRDGNIYHEYRKMVIPFIEKKEVSILTVLKKLDMSKIEYNRGVYHGKIIDKINMSREFLSMQHVGESHSAYHNLLSEI